MYRRPKRERRFPMEPRKFEKPLESRGEGPTSPPRQQESKRRFQIVRLEERIAPSHNCRVIRGHPRGYRYVGHC